MKDFNNLSDEQIDQLLGGSQPEQNNQMPVQQPASVSPYDNLSDDQVEALINARGEDLEKSSRLSEGLETMASTAGAFVAGFQTIPHAIKFDFQSTLNSLADFMGMEGYAGKSDEMNRELKAQLEFDTRNQKDPISGKSLAEDVEENPRTARGTRAIGALGGEAAALAAGTAALPIGVAGTAAGRLAQGAVSDVAQGAVLGGLQAEQDKGAAAASGGILSGVAAAPFRMAGEIARAGITGGRSAGAVNEAIAAGRQQEYAGGPISTGQATGSSTLQNIEQQSRKSPLFGANSFFERQTEKTQQTIADTMRRQGIDVDDLLESGYQGKTAGEVSGHLRTAIESNRTQSNNLYNKFLNSADAVLSDIPKSKDVAGSIVQNLGKSGDYVLLQPNSLTALRAQDIASRNNLRPRDIFELRKNLDSDITSITKQVNKSPADRQELVGLKALRNGLEDDMQSAAMSAGDNVLKQYNEARSYYKSNIVPLQGLESSLNKGKGRSGQIVSQIANMMSDTDPKIQGSAQKLLKAAGPDVQQSMRIHLATEAAQAAVDPRKGINPTKLAENYDSAVKKYGMVFNKDDRAIAQTLNNMSEYVTKKAGANSGIQELTFGTVLAPVFLGVKALSTTKVGRELLLRAAKLDPMDPKFRTFSDAIVNAGNRVTASMGPITQGIAGQQQGQQ